ncbi:hypothetical protein [Hymenobacter wooponensis]|uniref:STAS/SEC14 domain-containing protein n=1 Tax=Hymenobacter wooponensis TaxID=1525360 RepID=A0A4Z0MVF8_9BACT|nr:hypothetical protein [Hymenobacter wooponensis]TGD83288.1 hypothetical protein EU557_05770 [Hymenobacter wooponensis]
MLIKSIPDFCLQYDELLGLLRLEWISAGDTHTLQHSATQLLLLAQTLRVQVLLLDMNTVPNISIDDELWLGTHWMPGIVQLPLRHLVLTIDGSQVHNQLVVDALHDLVQPAIHFESHYFPTPEAALEYFAEGTNRLPQLLAEWRAR